MPTSHSLYDEMGIVTSQVVEEDGQFTCHTPGYTNYAQLPKCPAEVTMITNSCIVCKNFSWFRDLYDKLFELISYNPFILVS